jgi:hypothetical protein
MGVKGVEGGRRKLGGKSSALRVAAKDPASWGFSVSELPNLRILLPYVFTSLNKVQTPTFFAVNSVCHRLDRPSKMLTPLGLCRPWDGTWQWVDRDGRWPRAVSRRKGRAERQLQIPLGLCLSTLSPAHMRRRHAHHRQDIQYR